MPRRVPAKRPARWRASGSDSPGAGYPERCPWMIRGRDQHLVKVCMVVNEVTKRSTVPGAQEHDEGLVDPAVLGRSPNRKIYMGRGREPCIVCSALRTCHGTRQIRNATPATAFNPMPLPANGSSSRLPYILGVWPYHRATSGMSLDAPMWGSSTPAPRIYLLKMAPLTLHWSIACST